MTILEDIEAYLLWLQGWLKTPILIREGNVFKWETVKPPTFAQWREAVKQEEAQKTVGTWQYEEVQKIKSTTLPETTGLPYMEQTPIASAPVGVITEGVYASQPYTEVSKTQAQTATFVQTISGQPSPLPTIISQPSVDVLLGERQAANTTTLNQEPTVREITGSPSVDLGNTPRETEVPAISGVDVVAEDLTLRKSVAETSPTMIDQTVTDKTYTVGTYEEALAKQQAAEAAYYGQFTTQEQKNAEMQRISQLYAYNISPVTQTAGYEPSE